MLDLIISRAQVYDGTGAAPRIADVGVRSDRIAWVGDARNVPARERIVADSLCLCPGFIDVHTHSDRHVLMLPDGASKIYQGVTTEIAGNCGSSAAPAAREQTASLAGVEGEAVYRWRTVAEYRLCVERARPALNLALLVGHNNLRETAIGYADRRADSGDLRRMSADLEQALDEGGWGLSTGLIYSPGRYADRDELIALARVTGRRGGLYTTHLRNEAGGLLEAADEALDIGAKADIRVQISHLKAAGRTNWPLMDPALDRLRRAVAAGRPVAADRYPYTASSTRLHVILPAEEAAGTHDEILAQLRDPAVRARIRDRVLKGRPADYWDTILIASSEVDSGRWQGRRLADAALAWGLEPVDAAFRFIEEDAMKTQAIFFSMNEADMMRILAEPYVMIGSDGSIRTTSGPLAGGHPHPRSFGAHARFLRMALDGKTVSVAEAIRKMTSLPAETFGIHGRGVIREGAFADLVLFDPVRVRDRATYEQPLQYAEGFDTVIVNGVVTLRRGRPTGARAGRFLDRRNVA